MAKLDTRSLAGVRTASVPVCRDFDEDCDDVADKVKCYLYDPAKGMCPYLREATNG
jgi:hypothetical protein